MSSRGRGVKTNTMGGRIKWWTALDEGPLAIDI